MEIKYTAQDYKKGQPRWCPGCGDHFFLASLYKAMAEIGVAPHNIAVISGIGCSSRLPHYMNTYGMNTIHGRSATIATGCKVVNPELSVWQVSGDGDGLAIGTCAHNEVQCTENNTLTGTGLARQYGKTLMEINIQVANQRVVPYM